MIAKSPRREQFVKLGHHNQVSSSYLPLFGNHIPHN